jgi:hypothetical protein
MARLQKFVSAKELVRLQVAIACSSSFLANGTPKLNAGFVVELLRKRYGMPEGTGIDSTTGEFRSP